VHDDGMSISRSERYQEYLNGRLFTSLHVLSICCSASIQSVDPFQENRFQSVNADFVQKFSYSRKKFICTPELLSLEAVFEMPKKETRKNQKELSPASKVDVVHILQFAKNSSQNALVTFARCGLSFSACTTNLFSSLSSRRAMISVRIFQILWADVNISPFGTAWHYMTSTTWNPRGFQTSISIIFGL
jgi:hypothetical protein